MSVGNWLVGFWQAAGCEGELVCVVGSWKVVPWYEFRLEIL